MANLYFEFSDHVLSMKLFPHKYMSTSLERESIIVSKWSEYNMNAERVWCEQEGHVWFIKHEEFPIPEVDTKEFIWIKLQAHTI
jgi:hypothetical protein